LSFVIYAGRVINIQSVLAKRYAATMKMVVFTTLLMSLPASSKMILMFSKHCLV